MDEQLTPMPERVGLYNVEARLGAGGMGEVYRGWDPRLERAVALKRVKADVHDPEWSRQLLRREARSVARLHHAAIVQIYELVEGADEDWLVLELVDGVSLRRAFGTRPLEPFQTVQIARGIVEGLMAAHAAGIVHRDLKVDNVMVSSDGGIKILDFGICRHLPLEDSGELTQTLSEGGRILGTASAMSPEQVMGSTVDHRSDLFSLGCLMYELSTGQPPFVVKSFRDTMIRICLHKEIPVGELNLSVPATLSQLIADLLEKDPEQRPQSAKRVLGILDQLSVELMEAQTTDFSPEGMDAASHHEGAPRRAEAAPQEVTVAPKDAAQRLPDDIDDRSAERQTPSHPTIWTLLLCDLIDSTGWVEALGDEQASHVFEQHDRRTRDLLAHHDGREIDKSDGFLILFQRPMEAVQFALAYHESLETMGRQENVRIASRVGIHMGEVILRANPPEDVARGAKPLEVEGLAKNIAARLMSLAGPRQTMISRGVFDLGRRSAVGQEGLPTGLEWVSHGRYKPQGTQESLEVFEVGVKGRSPLTPPTSSKKMRRVRDKTPWIFGGASAALLAMALAFGVGFWKMPPQSEPQIEEAGLEALETHQLYEHAQELMLRYDKPGHLERAVEALQIMLGREPDSAAAYAGLAKAYLMSYSYTSRDPMWLQLALPAAQQAVELDPFLAAAHVGLGGARFETGEADGALESLNEARLLDPNNPDVHHGLGRISESEGDSESAERWYRGALGLQPTRLEFLLRMGVFLNRNARSDEAETFFLKSIEIVPDSVLGYRNLAGLYYLQGKLGQAAGMLQKSLEIQPHPTVYSNLGTLYFSQGLYQKSALAFEKAVAMPNGANRYLIWANLGDAYRWIPENEPRSNAAYLRAIQLLKEQVNSKPDDITLRSRLALYRAKRGEKEIALSMIEMPLQTLDSSALYRVAIVHELCDQRDQALGALATALQKGYSLTDVKSDPELLGLREDPQYHQLVMNFEAQ